MTDIVLVLGRNGEYLRIPTTGANRLYAPPQDLLGRNVRDVLPREAADEVCKVIHAALAAPEHGSVSYEYALPFPDKVVWFAASVTRLDDNSVVWVARDITRERNSGAAVQDSERRYRLLFERNPAPMWVFDEKTLEFLDVNAAAVEHYGYSREEFLRMKLLDLRLPEDLPDFLARRSTWEVGQRHHGRYRHRKKDGSIIDVEVVTESIESQGRPARLVLVTDVTERLRVGAQLLQSQKIEAIGLLAGGVAHDFNNILTAINGYAEFLIDALDDGDPRREDGQEIRKAATRGAGLTRQLLAFSRNQILKPDIVDLNEIVGEIRSMLERLIGEDIEIVVRFGRSLKPVLVDAGQMEQVLINLAVNARDAMPKGGTLTIATTNIVLDERSVAKFPGLEPGSYVRLSVSDSGTGMSPQVKAHIFEPFFTTKGPGRGTGLGLSTVHGIVTQSGGYISVESAEQQGTTFEILFPHTEPPKPASDHPAVVAERERPYRGTETVLLVEDEGSVRTLASRILTQHGHVVLMAANGKEALAISDAHGGHIDLVLTDAVMPGMCASDLIRALHGRDRRPGIKVLIMSGYTSDEILRRDIVTGHSALLDKPFTPEELMRAVRTVLDAPVAVPS